MMTRRDPQRGSAMLVTLILISALLAGVAVLVSLQLASTKSTELTRSGLAALHCAEAGLAASHNEIVAKRAQAITHIAANPYPAMVQPTFLLTALGTLNDIDGDGTADFEVYIVDNDDSGADYALDTDNRIYIISKCVKYPDNPKQVMELIEFSASPTMYDWQEGRGFGNNNANAY